ncbi:hypothetical protein [Campylobacter showae]|uniref:Uncharacterized protein n=1 Tax=Campylobacter showae CC57C TaxID=1073353 RepID=M3JD30_9BACT|nr:hypothetical protein [Campylobacter showae]EMG30592.1 hypothetical protein H740_05750 [Campylobacter showae CC57C]
MTPNFGAAGLDWLNLSGANLMRLSNLACFGDIYPRTLASNLIKFKQLAMIIRDLAELAGDRKGKI